MIWLPAGGSKSPPSAETVGRGEHFIRMEGRETYRFATRTLASTALAAIERAGLQPDDIDLVIPHQANVRIIEAVAKGLAFPMERIFVNVDRYGNTSAASVPLALAEAVDSGRVKVGDRIVFVAFGAGFTSGAVALEWTVDPAQGARAAAIDPDAIRVRLPVDWDSVDPIPPQLAAILASPGPAGRAPRRRRAGRPRAPGDTRYAGRTRAPGDTRNAGRTRAPGDTRNAGRTRAPGDTRNAGRTGERLLTPPAPVAARPRRRRCSWRCPGWTGATSRRCATSRPTTTPPSW